MTQQINTCACADRADQVFTGDVVIAKDAAGAGGNLTVENTLNVGTLNAGNIAVSTGQASVESAEITGDGTATVFPVSHSAGTRAVIVSVYNAAGSLIGVDTAATADDTVTLTFGTAPAAGTKFSVVIAAYQAPVITPEGGDE